MKSFLTETAAKARAMSILSGIKYDLFLHLQKGTSYSGLCDYQFKLANKNSVFLDFTGKSIESVTLNSSKLNKSDIDSIWQNGILNLPKSELTNGLNQLSIEFKNEYYNDGNGLHSFTDTDGHQYIYTQSEPFWTNRIFPIFDQPDIKGNLTLHAVAPADWTVIANSEAKIDLELEQFLISGSKNPEQLKIANLLQNSEFNSGKQRFHSFLETPLLPTYLYGFAAGPFSRIKSDPTKRLPGVDMSIYCRSSLVKFAEKQTEELFSYCTHATKFYSKFFQYDYPFAKFDYVFCPEYTVGAMEYPGIITFNDRYIFREIPNMVQTSHRGETIVHELAHMWFGNLVTMRWWNDLWLNEAFASWVSYLANDHINPNLSFKTIDSWTSFQLQKFRAYNEDQELTTHPIACEVSSTDKADSIFDAITYNKGASVLKQLYYLLGHQLFSDNIGSYFKEHQWSNSTLEDFLRHMSRNTEDLNLPFNLIEWNTMWIQTAGLNVVNVQWDFTKQGDSQMILHQSAAMLEHPLLRFHKMKLAFFDKNAKIVKVENIMLNNTPKTTLNFKNEAFAAVLPNYEDQTFIKLHLDNQSTQFFLNNFEKIECPQSRLLIVRSFFEMVRDAQMRADYFVDFLFKKFFLAKEIEDSLLFESIMSLVHESVFKYMSKDKKFESSHLVFQNLENLKTKQTKTENQKLIVKKMISFAFSEEDILTLKNILAENHESNNVLLGINDQWNIVIKIASLKNISEKEKKHILAKMEAIDQSDLMKYSNLFIENMNSDLPARKSKWEQIKRTDSKLSLGELEYTLSGIFSQLVSDQLKQPLWDKYFDVLPDLISLHSKTYAKTVLLAGLPELDDIDKLVKGFEKVQQNIDQNNEFFPILINKMIHQLRRKEKAIALFK